MTFRVVETPYIYGTVLVQVGLFIAGIVVLIRYNSEPLWSLAAFLFSLYAEVFLEGVFSKGLKGPKRTLIRGYAIVIVLVATASTIVAIRGLLLRWKSLFYLQLVAVELVTC